MRLFGELERRQAHWGCDVTVCVAAVCDTNMIIGASDRMITAGDVKFEPQQTKLVNLTSSIAIMIAGDSALQLEILLRVRQDVNRRVEAEPQNWWTVVDITELYRKYYNAAKLLRSEQAVLAPLGLTHETFIQKQREMEPSLVKSLATELINFETPVVQTIFAGADPTGTHLYVAHNGEITCHDGVGFAAIGAGYWHADSQLMFAGHTRTKPFPETLLLVYSAKKRAEVAPGVGEATDMFALGPRLGSYISVGDHVLVNLQQMYEKTQQDVKALEAQANVLVNKYVEEINRGATTKEQAPTVDVITGETADQKKQLEPATAEKKTEIGPKNRG